MLISPILDRVHSSMQIYNSPSLYSLFLPLEIIWNVADVVGDFTDVSFSSKEMMV
jgi:hypothetical protein